MNCDQFDASSEPRLRGETADAAEAHARECADCAARLAERQEALGALQRAPTPAPPPDLLTRITTRLARRRLLVLAGGSSAAVACAAAVGLVLWLQLPGGLQARGGAGAPARAPVELTLLCYDAADAAPDPAGHCRLDQLAGLAVRRPATAPAYLGVIGFQGAAPRYYFPSPVEPRSRATVAAARLQPVGPLVQLGVNHSPGPLRLVGVLSTTPLGLAELEAAARGELPPGAIHTETTVMLREAAP